jgi:DNA-binding NarL/FixJ family response regulator
MQHASGSAPIRVVIADDHAMLRKGVRTALDPEPTITVLGEVRSFRELMSLLEAVTADVVLLDLGGMGTAAVTAVSGLVRAYPRLAIVIFSSHLGHARELLKLGARGYVAKEDLEDDVLIAIRTVMEGKPFLSPSVVDYLERSGGARKTSGLTPREWDVLVLVAKGLGNDDIAVQLGVAYQTIGNYISSLYGKTGCTERTQLVDWYRRMSGREESV